MTVLPVTAIKDTEYIGDSLPTINNNFSNLSSNDFSLLSQVLSLSTTLNNLPSANRDRAGVVKIGNGLEITEDGVVSTSLANYTFAAPVTSVNSSVTLNYDSRTLGINEQQKLYVLKTNVDTWVENNSSLSNTVNTWYINTSSNILKRDQLSSIIIDFIPCDIRRANSWVINNSATLNVAISNLNSFIDVRDWVRDDKQKIVNTYTWAQNNSSSIDQVKTWVTENSSNTGQGSSQLVVNTSELGDKTVSKIIFNGNKVTSSFNSIDNAVTVNISESNAQASSIKSQTILSENNVLVYSIENYINNTPTNYIISYDGRLLIPEEEYEISFDNNGGKLTIKGVSIVDGKKITILTLQSLLLPESQYTGGTNGSSSSGISVFGDNTFLGNVTGINVTGSPTNVTVNNTTKVATINVNSTNSTPQQQNNTQGLDSLPTGTMMCFPNNIVPTGWRYCDGTSVDVNATDTYNKLVTALYCGDNQNNSAEYGFRSDSPNRSTEYYVTVVSLSSESQTLLGVRDDGGVTIKLRGGSGNYKVTVGSKEVVGGANQLLTIGGLNSGEYRNCNIIDITYNKVVTFDLYIRYGTQQSYIMFNSVVYNAEQTFASTTRNINGRYFYLPDLTEEYKRNKALFYCIKYI